jgi:hypothetical protein
MTTLVDSSGIIQPGDVVVSSIAVSGGTIYAAVSRPQGISGAISAPALLFQPSNVPSPTRYLSLTNAKADTGAALTATATGGAMGISRSAGTSLSLVNEVTSSSAKTDTANWEFVLPDSYVAGSSIPLLINASITGTGTLTGASCTITPTVYTESAAGAETSVTVSAAQQTVAAGSTLDFTITGTGLVAGQRLWLNVSSLVTSASGANTGHINSVAFQA